MQAQAHGQDTAFMRSEVEQQMLVFEQYQGQLKTEMQRTRNETERSLESFAV